MSKVLLIDDDKSVADIIKSELIKDKHEFIYAINGEQGIDLSLKIKPNLIILDLMLSDMDGYEVCSQLKGNEDTRNIPIIIISGKDSLSARPTSYRLGAINYIEKPFLASELRDLVKSISDIFNSKSNVEKIDDFTINASNFQIFYKNNILDFTVSEFRIFSYLLEHLNEVISREKIIGHAFPYNKNFLDRTVDTHMSHLRKKTKDTNISIKSIYGEGYKASITGKS